WCGRWRDRSLSRSRSAIRWWMSILSSSVRGVRLVRTPRPLPRVLSPAEAGALLDALRTRRDRAMVLAMLLGGLRRCEVLSLRLSGVGVGGRGGYAGGEGGR